MQRMMTSVRFLAPYCTEYSVFNHSNPKTVTEQQSTTAVEPSASTPPMVDAAGPLARRRHTRARASPRKPVETTRARASFPL
jgi:hypothetical protein